MKLYAVAPERAAYYIKASPMRGALLKSRTCYISSTSAVDACPSVAMTGSMTFRYVGRNCEPVRRKDVLGIPMGPAARSCPTGTWPWSNQPHLRPQPAYVRSKPRPSPMCDSTFTLAIPEPSPISTSSPTMNRTLEMGMSPHTHEAHASTDGRLVRVDERKQMFQSLPAPPVDQRRILLVACEHRTL